MFWVNPFGMSFRHIRVSDLIAVNHEGDVVHGNKPVNQAGFVIHSAVHAAHPDVVAAAHAHSVYGKAWSSLGRPLDPITQDACTLYENHGVVSEGRGAVVLDPEVGRALAAGLTGPQDGVPPEPRHLLASARPSPRPRGGSSTPSATARPSCSPRPRARRPQIDHENAKFSAEQTGTAYAGWFSFQPLWDEVVRTDPDLFD